MLSESLISELQKLSHADKLRVVQMLVNQLAHEEEILTAAEYEIWSPYDVLGAAEILTKLLGDSGVQVK